MYELQDIGVMKSVSSTLLTEREGEMCLEQLNITSTDSAALFEFLGHSETLKRLILKECTMLGSNYCYREMEKSLLNTAGNTIASFSCIGSLPDEGVKYLCKAMKGKNCELIELDLSHNGITDEGAKYLSEALKSNNCKVTELNLAGNEINNQGVNHLCKTLENENCTLRELDLQRNKISEHGFKYLTDAFKVENCKLATLYISDYINEDDGTIKTIDPNELLEVANTFGKTIRLDTQTLVQETRL